MSSNSVLFYDKISKKNVSIVLNDELRDKIFEAAGNFFPYPIIISHDGHYTILHLDQDFKDRGTLHTKIFIDLESYNKQKSDKFKEIAPVQEEQAKGTLINLENAVNIIKEQVVCELKEDVLNQILNQVKTELHEQIKEQIQIELSAAALNTADVIIKELKEPGSSKRTKKKSTSKKSTTNESENENEKSKILTLDQLSGMGLEDLTSSDENEAKKKEKS
jgi:hypothetical protein